MNDTKINLAWFKKNARNANIADARLILSDVRLLVKTLSTCSVDAIITEPYLGSPLKSINQANEMNDLEKLYCESIAECAKILQPNGVIVIIFPIIQNKRISLECFIKSGFIQDKFFAKFYDDHNRESFIYQRTGQRIAREIFVLRR
jgi:tRNA G10  N-methylase Trm11